MKQAIILAGGLGTRLQPTLPDLPKCLAPVAGKPFLFHIVNYLRSQGINEFIFSIGHLKELVVQYLYEDFATLDYKLSIEDEPLGTGGAIKQSMEFVTGGTVLVANGDTLFKVNIPSMLDFHGKKKASCTLALKPMQHFDRYGAVELDENQSVKAFREKKIFENGLVNGGFYILNKQPFLGLQRLEKFSFESQFLEKHSNEIYGFIQDKYFIDIGIPEDYYRADRELKRTPMNLGDIDKSWTLFLDRDGVINHEKPDGYILNANEFVFYEGVKETFHLLNQKFGKIIVVTNQRGIGKGMMTEESLHEIHEKMKRDISEANGKIDSVYYCTSVDNRHPERKPNPGMAFRAMNELPGIVPEKSIIAGNKLSDMKFGRNSGLYSIYIRSTHPEQALPHPDIDMAFDSLADFARSL